MRCCCYLSERLNFWNKKSNRFDFVEKLHLFLAQLYIYGFHLKWFYFDFLQKFHFIPKQIFVLCNILCCCVLHVIRLVSFFRRYFSHGVTLQKNGRGLLKKRKNCSFLTFRGCIILIIKNFFNFFFNFFFFSHM